MVRKCRVWVGVAAMAVGIGVVLVGGCGDDPVSPPPVTDDEYLIYFYSLHDYSNGYDDSIPRFMSYNPYTDVLDTFMLPITPTGDLGISPDGRTLYVTTATSVAVVDLGTKQVTRELPYTEINSVAASQDGSMIALLGEGLWILRTGSWGVLYHDSISVARGSFSDSGDRFYYARGEGGACVITLDDMQPQGCRRFRTPYGFAYAGEVDAVAGGGQWVLYSYCGDELWVFSTYDVAGDTIVFEDPLVPGQGEFAITPDDRLVFYTNPGGLIGVMPPTFDITVFDVASQTIVDRISTIRYEDTTAVDFVAANELCITPDGNWLLATSQVRQDALLLINIETLAIERYIYLGGWPFIMDAVCQGRM